MDDVLRRLGLVESAVAELRGDVRHLATKADLKEEVGALRAELKEGLGSVRAELKQEVGILRAEMKEELGSVRAEVGSVRAELKQEVGVLRAELKEELGSVRAEMREQVGLLATQLASLEGRIIRWLVGTMVASIGTAAAVAKLLI